MRLSVAAFFLVAFFYGSSAAQELVTLDQVITLALEKNYDVRLAKNTSTAAATNDNYSIGALLPQVNAVGAAVWNQNHQEFEFEDETRNVSGDAKSNNLSGSVQLVWTLFDGTKMFVAREAVAEMAALGELNVRNQMVNSIAAVINNYYAIVGQKQRLVSIQEQMSVNEERVKLAERKLQVGTGGKPELLQAKVDLNAQRTLLIQQETLLVQAKELLNGLAGLQLPTPYDVADSIVIDLNITQDAIANDIENKNYLLRMIEKDQRIGKLALNMQRADRSPIINFNAAYNYSETKNTLLINPFSSLVNQSNGYNYGLSFTLPILNGFNIKREIQQAKLTVNRQQLLYDQQKQQIDIGVRNAFVNYENAKEVLLIEEENILLAKENVTIALESFRRGIATFIELRTAQQSLADGYNRLINSRYLAKIAETELLRLNGELLK
jgi:outer membrane protein TolC